MYNFQKDNHFDVSKNFKKNTIKIFSISSDKYDR